MPKNLKLNRQMWSNTLCAIHVGNDSHRDAEFQLVSFSTSTQHPTCLRCFHWWQEQFNFQQYKMSRFWRARCPCRRRSSAALWHVSHLCASSDASRSLELRQGLRLHFHASNLVFDQICACMKKLKWVDVLWICLYMKWCAIIVAVSVVYAPWLDDRVWWCP